MALKNRTYNLGKLEELKSQVKASKIRIDGLAKNIIYHFEPLDSALDYVESIDPTRLEIYMHDLKHEVVRMKKSLKEIESLKDELGDDSAS